MRVGAARQAQHFLAGRQIDLGKRVAALGRDEEGGRHDSRRPSLFNLGNRRTGGERQKCRRPSE